MNDVEIEEFCLLAQKTATQAGRLLETNRTTEFDISKKGRINLVTEMDLRSEKLIVESILAKFPDHQILAEEKGVLGGKGPVRWISLLLHFNRYRGKGNRRGGYCLRSGDRRMLLGHQESRSLLK